MNLKMTNPSRVGICVVVGLVVVGLTYVVSGSQFREPDVTSQGQPLTMEQAEQGVQALLLQYVTLPDEGSYRVLGTFVLGTEIDPALGCYAILQDRGRVPCLEVLRSAQGAF